MLEEVRDLYNKKREEVLKDANAPEDRKKFVNNAVALFANDDAIRMLSTAELTGLIRWVGIERDKAYDMALQIEKEVRKKYRLVNPETFGGK